MQIRDNANCWCLNCELGGCVNWTAFKCDTNIVNSFFTIYRVFQSQGKWIEFRKIFWAWGEWTSLKILSLLFLDNFIPIILFRNRSSNLFQLENAR